MTDTPKLPETLFTAVGVFQAGPRLNVEVSVPNFLTKEDAEAYAEAFRIVLADGQLRRDDGKGAGVFDESWREVLDTNATLFRVQAAGGAREPVEMPIAQWQSEPGLATDFQPIAWRVKEDKI